MKLDPLDERIVLALREDARLSFRALARRVGTTTPTAAARVRALEAAGVLRAYRAVLAPGEGQEAHVLTLRTRPADAARVASDLASIPGVLDVTILTGGVLHARAHVDPAQLAALQSRLAAMADLLGFEHARILDTTPEAPPALGLGAAVACHTCGGPVAGLGLRKTLGGRAHVFCCRVCQRTMEERFEKASAVAGPRRG